MNVATRDQRYISLTAALATRRERQAARSARIVSTSAFSRSLLEFRSLDEAQRRSIERLLEEEETKQRLATG